MSDTWIVTSYFNPCRYQTRRLNFEKFYDHLGEKSSNLVVVEMAPEDSQFQLDGFPQVVRICGNEKMWQKERMLNVAIETLPRSCEKVVWLDCDLLFTDAAWMQKTSSALDTFALVQPFDTCIRLDRGHVEYAPGREEDDDRAVGESFAAAFARDPSLAHTACYDDHGHTGLAWAARREILDGCGLYDACLTGSGDHLMAHVFAGARDSPCIPAMIGAGNAYADHFSRWAAKAHGLCKGRLGFVPGQVLHLWHGAASDRRYRTHNQNFKAFEFDPDRHIRHSEAGLWEWADAPDAMRDWADSLFASRREDGDVARHGPDG